MSGIKRSASDLLGDDEKKIRIVSDGDMGSSEISYVIAGAGDLDQEEGITLDNIAEVASSSDLQIATTDSGSVQIVTSGGEDGFITSDGHIISQNDDNELIINTEDGQQVFLQDGGIVDPVQSLEMQPEDRLNQIEDIGAEQETSVAENEEEPQYQNLIIQHMNISEPLTTLKKLLQQRLGTSLHNHDFFLQDIIPLDPTKNLTSQCVQGSGMVQINVEVKSQPGQKPRLNIVDILKPAEELIEMQPTPEAEASPAPTKKVVIPFPEESENVTRWIVDQNYRKEQQRLGIPEDPVQWNESHVRHWITWAVKKFNLKNVDINNFTMTGKQLCELKHEQFVRYIPSDKGDVFWTHLELLRRCKYITTIQQPTPHAITTITVSSSDPQFAGKIKSLHQPRAKPRSISVPHTQRITSGNRTGNNGQIQLWQFLLELLTDKDYLDIIHWVGEEGEFKLNNPEVVAQLWGQRKNKPTMNYEKLSRALRYYYDGDMIAKVHGKRFVYKFVCDLRMLLGYSAADLRHLVCECGQKHMLTQDSLQKHSIHSRPIILQK